MDFFSYSLIGSRGKSFLGKKGLKFGEDERRWLNTNHEVSILFLICVSRNI